MEAFGVFLDEEWESLTKMFSSENSDLLLHFNEENLFPNVVADQSLSFPSEAFDQTNFYFASHESSNISGIEGARLSDPIDKNGVNFLHNVTTNTFDSTDFCTGLMAPVFLNDHMMEEIVLLEANAEDDDFCKGMTFKRKYETAEIQTQDSNHSSDQSPKKKPWVSKENGLKNKRNTQSKRNKRVVQNEEEENVNDVGNRQSSSTCSYEEDDSNCNASQELNGGSTSESKGKAKAIRSSATDPQSLYARRRRERINERLRMLQNLVPNGTKVDISTMLEEAVHYVKFLQLQIKLLSSDELWMYAPIAYNGMDMGLYQKIIPNLLSRN